MHDGMSSEEPPSFMKRIIAKNKKELSVVPACWYNYLKAKCANTQQWSEFYLSSLPKVELGVGWGGRWEGDSRRRGHTCTCD